jgi:proprotein convertase subtilisin/kexin type 5
VTKTCDNCPEGCKTCDSDVKCLDCINHYYFDTTVELCFSCYQNCKSCIGPGQDQCLSCYEPLYFKSNKCHNLTCPYGQYVDSVLGCKYCSDLFSNSLTCNKSEAFLCLDAYKLKDGQCKICSDVEGYHITPSTRTCS